MFVAISCRLNRVHVAVIIHLPILKLIYITSLITSSTFQSLGIRFFIYKPLVNHNKEVTPHKIVPTFDVWYKCSFDLKGYKRFIAEFNLTLPTPKVITICHQYRARPSCTPVQSDQSLNCWLTNFKFLFWYPFKW